ncbi:hypothetical protein BaRGS_00026129, partial [Batillaria attramentaria]
VPCGCVSGRRDLAGSGLKGMADSGGIQRGNGVCGNRTKILIQIRLNDIGLTARLCRMTGRYVLMLK